MKKALFVGIFSLLVIAPLRYALGQAGSSVPDAKALEKSSAGASSTTDERRIQDPAPEAAAANGTAKNQTPKTTELPETGAEVLSGAALEAQKNYDAGVALYDSGKLDEAIDALKQAKKLNPNDPQTHYMLGMVYSKSKAYKEAADSFSRAVKLKPDWPEAYFKLGVMFYVLGRKSKSNEAYKKLLELNSPLANTLYRINKEVSNAADGAQEVEAESASSGRKQVAAEPVPSNTKELEVESAPPSTKQLEAESTHSSVKQVAAESATLTTKHVEVVAVSSPDPIVTSNERPSPANGDSNSNSTTAASPPVTHTANSDPALANKKVASDDSVLTGIYKIGVGDVLDIRLLNSTTNRSTLYSVNDGGLIDFPISSGPISVAGLTTKEIQARITSELARLAVEGGAQVAVGVRQYASHTVIITGLVSSPGPKILRREAVPLYVLLAESQPRLDAARAVVMRAGATSQVVDLSDSAALNIFVRPGDVINVSARPQEFYYIAGRLNYPGQKAFQPGITLVQAILAAGGLARNNFVELSREGSDGRLSTTKFNLKEIKSGKIQDPKLQPGDRIEVLH